ncbi:hypothetical protein Acr_12g0002170 [Actinidia rufa]|uniref:RRP15-like protein n=1 Tax=Actinidia rufa TaxID=165716 RepID=A0A7J0FGW0_9ERIC|nr:hypothetical protein Acr_12g0002170 [Actinidia rufa]
MAEEAQTQETGSGLRKRRMGNMKGGKAKKKLKVFQGTGEKVKIDKKMKKLFRKRVRDYNSDDDDEPSPVARDGNEQSHGQNDVFDGKSSDEEGEERQNDGMENEESEDEHGEIQPGITKFTEGCNAFRMAFKKITKKNVSDDLLGPVLSAHKKLWAEKLAEEEAEKKVKGEAKKEKHMVNKAQNAQKGLNPSRTKDVKAIRKRRKEAFFSELGKTSSQTAETPTKASASAGTVDGEGPAWAPLRDSYMLTNPKLKDWDKLQDTTVADNVGTSDSSSDDD